MTQVAVLVSSPALPVASPLPAEAQAAVVYLEELLETGEVELPMLPRVATEVLALTNDADANAPRLAELIHQDPALAAHVLRISNTPAYAGRAKVVSLQQAVSRLGFATLAQVTMAAALQGGVFRSSFGGSLIAEVWQHSVCTGAVAREVARQLRTNVEAAFLGGLLHWVGKPVILQALETRGDALPGDTLVAILDQLHVPFGELVATRWDLPDSVRASMSYASAQALSEATPVEASVVRLATALAGTLLSEDFDGQAVVESSAPTLERLNLYAEDLTALLERRRDSIRSQVEAMSL